MNNICQDLLGLDFKEFRLFFESFDTVICDCDGKYILILNENDDFCK